MEAIDFKKLLLEERKQAKMLHSTLGKMSDGNDLPKHYKHPKKIGDIKTQKSNESDPKWLPDWPHPPGLLSMKALSLQTICDNPSLISYSNTTFEGPSPEMSLERFDGNPNPAASLETWLCNLPSGDTGRGEWKSMSYGKRRVCMFGEMNEDQGAQDSLTTNQQLLPSPLQELAQELVLRGVFPPHAPPNHVLLNEYQPGQGIMPHTDGPLYESRTATMSLASSVVMEFSKRQRSSENEGDINSRSARISQAQSSSTPLQVLLKSGSLLVFQDEAYLDYCHGIEMDVWQDVTTSQCLNAPANQIVVRGLRYSLTFRRIKPTSSSQNIIR